MAKTKTSKKVTARKAAKKSTTKTDAVAVVLVLAQRVNAFTVTAEFGGMTVPIYECITLQEATRKARAWARRAPGRRPRPLKGVLVGSCSVEDRTTPAAS